MVPSCHQRSAPAVYRQIYRSRLGIQTIGIPVDPLCQVAQTAPDHVLDEASDVVVPFWWALVPAVQYCWAARHPTPVRYLSGA